MNQLIEQTKKTLRQPIQGAIAFMFTIALCYVVVFGDGDYKDLFAYAITSTLGFYFGRETKTDN